MRVLVTGHLGYIGSHAVDLLKQAGHHVTGVDVDLFGECEIYPPARPDESRILDVFDLRPADLDGFDAVIHLAAISNDAMGILNPQLTRRVNCEGTIHVAECARLAGVPRFLLSSSCSIYGKSGDKPVDEAARTAPVSVYAETKIQAEAALTAMADSRFSPVYLRNATAYGTSPRFRVDLVLNNLLASAYSTGTIQVLTDGSPWRPLIHCRDIARAFVFFLTAPKELVHAQAFNIGSASETYQVRDVAEVVQHVMPRCAITFAEGAGSDPRDYKVDFSKLNTFFPEFQLASTLRDGAEELHDHFERYRVPADVLTSERFVRVKALKRKIAERRTPPYFRMLDDGADARGEALAQRKAPEETTLKSSKYGDR